MDVKVTANGNAAGGIDWDLDGKKPHQSQIDFPKGTGARDVAFKLFDRTGRNLRFDSAAPIWDHVHDTDCPPSGAASGQIDIVDCSDKQLSVNNKNSAACTLHYQLNFVDGNGQAEAVDPMFKNGGGG